MRVVIACPSLFFSLFFSLCFGCDTPVAACPEGHVRMAGRCEPAPTMPVDGGVAMAIDGAVDAADGSAPELDGSIPAEPDVDGGSEGPDGPMEPMEPDCEPKTWYADADEDGFGDPDVTMEACEAPDGYVADGTDCDDACESCHPEGEEVCDGLDNDCDGGVDVGLKTTFYRDADEDGHGDPGSAMDACEAPDGYVTASDDCDDGCADCHPGHAEDGAAWCDGSDNDCDGDVDEGLTTRFFVDCDGDGYAATAEGAVDVCGSPGGGPAACAAHGEWTERDPGVAGQVDCSDVESRAYPWEASARPEGGPTYREMASPTEGFDPFDWNCDGSVTQVVVGDGFKYGSVSPSAYPVGGNCSRDCRDHWRSVPVCGQTIDLVDCERSSSFGGGSCNEAPRSIAAPPDGQVACY